MNINSLSHVCLENVLIHLSPYDDLHQCKQVCRLWHNVTHEAVKRLRREFRKSLLSQDLESHAFDAKRNEITPRYSHSSCVFEGQLYVFGGSTKERNLFNDLWTFSLSTKSWNRPHTTGVYPSPKARASLVIHNRKLLLFGGQSLNRYAFGRETWKLFNELYEFDMDQSHWSLVPAVNEGPSVSSHAACMSGDRMIVYGGLMLTENRTPVTSSELWTFDMKSLTWEQIVSSSPRPTGRVGHSLIVLDQYHFLLLGGSSDPGFFLNDMWVLKLMGQTAVWTTIIVRQSDSIPLQPKMNFNPVCKVSHDQQLLVLNFKRGARHDLNRRPSDSKCPLPLPHDEDRGAESTGGNRTGVSLYFLDISTVLNYGHVTWKRSLNKIIPGPESVMLYTLHLTDYEIVLFGGMAAPAESSSGSAGTDFPRVSNKLYIISSKKQVT